MKKLKQMLKAMLILSALGSNSNAVVMIEGLHEFAPILMGDLIIFIPFFPVTPKDPLATTPLVADEVVLDKTYLLSIVNQARSEGWQCGDTYYDAVSSVIWRGQLESAARVHSDDMHRNTFFSHTGTNGSSVADRLDDQRYDWSTYGESLAMGFDTEQEVVNAWINSPTHCTNIMNPLYKEMGISKVGEKWTMILGDRLIR